MSLKPSVLIIFVSGLLNILTIVIVLLVKEKNEKVDNVALSSTYNELVFKSMPEKEYQAASSFFKRLIDKIDASVTALNIIKKNSSIQSQAVIFDIHTNEKKALNSFFSTSLIIFPNDSSDTNSTSSKSGSSENTNPSFTIRAPGTASAFIKAAKAYMAKNKKEELTVYLSSVRDCIKISFE